MVDSRKFVRVTSFGGGSGSSGSEIFTGGRDGFLEGRKRLLKRETSRGVSTIETTLPSRISTIVECDLNLSGSSSSSNDKTRNFDELLSCRSDTRSTLQRINDAERTSSVTCPGRFEIARYSKQAQPCLLPDESVRTLRRSSCWIKGYRTDFRLQKKNQIEYKDPRDRIGPPRQTRKMSVVLHQKQTGETNVSKDENTPNGWIAQKGNNNKEEYTGLAEALIVKPARINTFNPKHNDNELDSLLRRTSKLVAELNEANARSVMSNTPRTSRDISKFNNSYKSYTQIVGNMRTRRPGMRNDWFNEL